jgi:hypothetical protein
MQCVCGLPEGTNVDNCERCRLLAKCQLLHDALVGLVGVSSREELLMMEGSLRSMNCIAPNEDIINSINAVHALLKCIELEQR